MFITIISFSIPTGYYNDALEKIEKKCTQISEANKDVSYSIFFTIGKYDLTAIFASSSERIMEIIESESLYNNFYFQQVKTAWVINKKKIDDFSELSSRYLYAGVCYASIKKKIYREGRELNKLLMYRAMKKLEKKFGSGFLVCTSFGYEDIILIMFSNSMSEINNSIFDLRSINSGMLRSDYNIEDSSIIQYENYKRNKGIRGCYDFFHVFTGTNTVINISKDKILDPGHNWKTDQNARIQTCFRSIPGHIANSQNCLNADRQKIIETIGDYDFIYTHDDMESYIKSMKVLLSDSDKMKKLSIKKIHSNIFFESCNGDRDDIPIDPRNYSIGIKNSLCCNGNIPEPTMQHLKTFLELLMLYQNRGKESIYLSSLDSHCKKVFTLLTIITPDLYENLEDWMSHVSEVLSHRYLSVHALLDQGEIHKTFYRGYYLKILYSVDIVAKEFLRHISESENQSVANSHSIFSTFYHSNIPRLFDDLNIIFNCSFLKIPFYFQYKKSLFSILLHEVMHVYLENENFENNLLKELSVSHLLFDYSNISNSKILRYNEKGITQVNTLSNIYSSNQLVKIKKYILEKDKKQKVSVALYENTISTLGIIEEIICDYTFFCYTFHRNIEKYYDFILTYINTTRVFNKQIYFRLIGPYTWSLFLSGFDPEKIKEKVHTDLLDISYLKQESSEELATFSAIMATEKKRPPVEEYFIDLSITCKFIPELLNIIENIEIVKKIPEKIHHDKNLPLVVKEFLHFSQALEGDYNKTFIELWWKCIEESDKQSEEDILNGEFLETVIDSIGEKKFQKLITDIVAGIRVSRNFKLHNFITVNLFTREPISIKPSNLKSLNMKKIFSAIIDNFTINPTFKTILDIIRTVIEWCTIKLEIDEVFITWIISKHCNMHNFISLERILEASNEYQKAYRREPFLLSEIKDIVKELKAHRILKNAKRGVILVETVKINF